MKNFNAICRRIFLYLLAGIGTLTAVTVVALIVITLQAGEREPLPEKIVLMVDLARGVSERRTQQAAIRSRLERRAALA